VLYSRKKKDFIGEEPFDGVYLNPCNQSITPKALLDLPLILNAESDFLNVFWENEQLNTVSQKLVNDVASTNSVNFNEDNSKADAAATDESLQKLRNINEEHSIADAPAVDESLQKLQNINEEHSKADAPAADESLQKLQDNSVTQTSSVHDSPVTAYLNKNDQDAIVPLEPQTEKISQQNVSESQKNDIARNKSSATDDFDVLISALENLGGKTAQKKSSKSSLYHEKIKKIIQDADDSLSRPKLNIEPHTLETSEAYRKTLSSIKETLETSKINLDTIREIADYLERLNQAEKTLLPQHNKIMKTTSSVEAIYDVVKSINSSGGEKNITTPDAKNDKDNNLNDEANLSQDKSALNNSTAESFEDDGLHSEKVENNALVSNSSEDPKEMEKVPNEFIKAQDGLLNLPTDFENLSIDDKLAVVQQQSLAQLDFFNEKFGDLKAKTQESNRKALDANYRKYADEKQEKNDPEEEKSVATSLDNALASGDTDDHEDYFDNGNLLSASDNSSSENNSDNQDVLANNDQQQMSASEELNSQEPTPMGEAVSLKCALDEALNSHKNTKIGESSPNEHIKLSDDLVNAVTLSLKHELGNNVNMASLLANKHIENDKVKSLVNTSSPADTDNKEQSLDNNDIDNERNEEQDESDESEECIPPSVTVSNDSYNTESQHHIYEKEKILDGNPASLHPHTIKIMEDYDQYENRKLGRPLVARDYYGTVMQKDDWFATILNSGCNDGPVFAALCYSRRDLDENDRYHWTLTVFKDFELIVSAPDFHHNVRTRFSIFLKHPIELTLKISDTIPQGCPEDLARKALIEEVEKEKAEFKKNKRLMNFFRNLGEDIDTMNITIYTQEKNKNT